MLKNKKIIITTIFLILLAGTVIGSYVYVKSNEKPTTAEEAILENPGKNDAPEPQKSSQSNLDKNTTNHNLPAPKAPTLIKSSGNNGPVPVGANIEFVCQAQPGYSCNILLENGSRKIELGSKTIQPSQTSISSAYWYWEAQKGNWSVTAIVQNAAGGKASSAPQKLVVE